MMISVRLSTRSHHRHSYAIVAINIFANSKLPTETQQETSPQFAPRILPPILVSIEVLKTGFSTTIWALSTFSYAACLPQSDGTSRPPTPIPGHHHQQASSADHPTTTAWHPPYCPRPDHISVCPGSTSPSSQKRWPLNAVCR